MTMSLQHSLLLNHDTLNKGTEEELDCWGYEESAWKKLLFYLLVILTLGLILLIISWKPELECYLKCRRCTLYKAKFLLLQTRYGFMSVIKVEFLTDPIDGEHVGNYTESRSGVSEVDDDTARLSSAWVDAGESEVGIRYFDFQNTRYLWDQNKHTFKVLQDLSSSTTCLMLHENFNGLSSQQRAARLNLYGPNCMKIHVPSYWALFIGEVLNPFYIFQIASIVLWSIDEYYYYASCIFLISAISITISLRETKKQRTTLRDMVATKESIVKVMNKDQELIEIPEHELVAGDVLAIPPNGFIMTCDAVLTAGTCIVNESMLTGESVPVTKTPLQQQEDEETYSPEVHKKHTLFAGTHIVQTRYYGQAKVLAVVVRTGFNTAKGELVRAILFPKPLDFEFYRDAIRFILFLSIVASIGMVYALVTYITHEEPVERTILRVLDIVTIVVPPALPAAMTVGTVYAQSRLKKGGIFCISPPRINFCGRINVFCFDKTGTLTEDGLDMWGVVPVQDNIFQPPVSDPSILPRGPLLVSLASCHSLTIIDGELSGDPLDLIMFNSIKWFLEEPGADTHKYDTIMPTVVKPYSSDTFLGEEEEFEYLQKEHPFEVGIIRQFTFSSSAQRMSVITRTMGEDHMEIYAKGAPEKIASLCRPETVPSDFSNILHDYSIQGFRVLALAHRHMDPKVTWHQAQRIARDKVERDLTFLGLLVMQNQLKPQTAPVIKTLKDANIRSVMITGDMLQTAISVGRNCGMVGKQDSVVIVNAQPPEKDCGARVVWEEAAHPSLGTDTDGEMDGEWEVENAPLLANSPDRVSDARSQGKKYTKVKVTHVSQQRHLAINGKSLAVISNHFPELLPKICVQGTIFARMSPDQKCQLIEQLQKLDYIVGMCGDGANDCEALKAAHAGISLSEAEASVAAPFTSRVNNIECVVTAIRQGRAALVTSFGCFKYMALYSFIQFVTVLILYSKLTNLSDFEYLHIDLVITTTIAILLGNTGAYHLLVSKKPPGSLMKPSNLVSIITQVLLVGIFQMAGYLYLSSQPFYTPSPANESAIQENSSLLGDSDEKETKTWESTIMFILSSFMYISVAFTFSTGPPFRKPIYTNVLFLLDLIILTGISVFLLLLPLAPVADFLMMMPLQDTSLEFRLVILSLAAGFALSSLIFEWIVISSGLLKCLYNGINKIRNYHPPQYKVIWQEIEASDWPDTSQVTFPTVSHQFPQSSVVDMELNHSP